MSITFADDGDQHFILKNILQNLILHYNRALVAYDFVGMPSYLYILNEHTPWKNPYLA